MRKIAIGWILIAGVFLFAVPPALANEEGYFAQMSRTMVTGLKNIVSSPWEIPYTMGQYDQKDDGNSRAIRGAAGFVDGTFRSLTRFCCGFWDVAFSVVPGDQEGLPLKPETFF
ncbi:MAG TPA: hypothetical protein PLO78_04650 [Candidatus Omnitrophota bacterium]|nr:hypothetical protein [Candidatus Omnitrophota bacterium]